MSETGKYKIVPVEPTEEILKLLKLIVWGGCWSREALLTHWENLLETAVAPPPPTGAQGSEGWRPIETAPKDGENFLGWSDLIGSCAVVHWNKFSNCFSESIGGADVGTTHWMPLPPTPQAPGGGG